MTTDATQARFADGVASAYAVDGAAVELGVGVRGRTLRMGLADDVVAISTSSPM